MDGIIEDARQASVDVVLELVRHIIVASELTSIYIGFLSGAPVILLELTLYFCSLRISHSAMGSGRAHGRVRYTVLGAFLDAQTIKKNPSGHPKFFVWNFKKSQSQAYN